MTHSDAASWLYNRKRSHVRRGIAPGSIIVDPHGERPKITICGYGEFSLSEQTVDDTSIIPSFLDEWTTTWVHVEGLSDAAIIAELGRIFKIHKLALEDVVNRNQHPKLEPYEEHLYIVALAIPGVGRMDMGQVNIFVGEKFILTLQERNLTWDLPVRERIRQNKTRIRILGANYLANALLDSIIDQYFPVLEDYSERLDNLESEVLVNPDQDGMTRIHEIRNELLALRRELKPLKELLRDLYSEDYPLIAEETRLFLRDCHDHVANQLETIETSREFARSLLELCLSSLSNRMNEVMKVLTIIATIFIPLSFIAGIYGMNFNTQKSAVNMPELNWAWGYPFALGIMVTTTLGLLLYFRRKGWLGKHRKRGDGNN